MKPVASLIGLAGLLLLAPLGAGAAGKVSFTKDIVPVLRANCATCHLTGQEAGNLKLHPGAAYASLVKVASVESPLKRIEPGAPERSYLMHKLDGTHLDAGGMGDQMPFGADPLDEGTRNLIRRWISAGAPNN
ncbi:hypothetical protein [Zoogloea sp.]|uniref:hypothetical protein n=1 Tax=Zoogloea sp. TaxID=49181 RepID=UPI00262005B3|nr:hypothetical protein [Zoogloea sp.]MDD3352087.1 hypothetical protein [Zoogloea sp.]